MKTISFYNNKGGVAKTTCCIHLAAYLAMRGKKTLLIDFDTQMNATTGYGLKDYSYTVYDLLEGNEGFRLMNKYKNLYVLAGSKNLSKQVFEMSILKERLEQLNNISKTDLGFTFDYVIIDCSPTDILKQHIVQGNKTKLLPKLNQIALYASDYVAVPLLAEEFSVEGLVNFFSELKHFKNEFNPSLEVIGVFFNRVEVNKKMFKEFYEEAKNSLPKEYFIKHFIRKDTLIGIATKTGESIFKTAPKTRAAEDFKNVCKSLMKNIEYYEKKR